jgi:hypothetical protein
VTRLQNLVALSTACQTAHDDAVRAGDEAAVKSLRDIGRVVAHHIGRYVKVQTATTEVRS